MQSLGSRGVEGESNKLLTLEFWAQSRSCRRKLGFGVPTRNSILEMLHRELVIVLFGKLSSCVDCRCGATSYLCWSLLWRSTSLSISYITFTLQVHKLVVLPTIQSSISFLSMLNIMCPTLALLICSSVLALDWFNICTSKILPVFVQNYEACIEQLLAPTSDLIFMQYQCLDWEEWWWQPLIHWC